MNSCSFKRSFINDAFRSRIMPAAVSAGRLVCQDELWLLSCDELGWAGHEDAARCAFDADIGAETLSDSLCRLKPCIDGQRLSAQPCWWWLRSAFMLHDGYAGYAGFDGRIGSTSV